MNPRPNPVMEGTAAAFTLTRTGDTAAALTVDVSVSETGAMVSGTAPATATFAADSSTAALSVATEDDAVVEAVSTITATVAAGTGYSVDASASSAEVAVNDNDVSTFTDDGGTEETLLSEATATVAAAPPEVSIAAETSPVTEGTAASFMLSRTGDTTDALTVAASVSEAGTVLSGTSATTATFAAGSGTATLTVATEDDGVAEADGRVTASLVAGSGYTLVADAGSARVVVYDNDEAATTGAAETLWASTLTVMDYYGIIIGLHRGLGGALSPDSWTEDVVRYSAGNLYFFPSSSELVFSTASALPESGQLTLHLDDLRLQLDDVEGLSFFVWAVEDPGWQDGQEVAAKLTREEPAGAVATPPGISVADAQVQEAEGAVLSFRVTLDAVQTSSVSVRYATSDGTAVAGADYEAVSGALRFEAGQTEKTVRVPVLNDSHDEGSETLTLTLSRPFGAEFSDAQATGTIANTGPIPQAWLARFGRTAAEHVLEGVEERLTAAREPGSH